MARIMLFLFTFFCYSYLAAQYYNGRVRVDSLERSYIFQITDKHRNTSRYRYYSWFKSGRIHRTQGSYYGKLLHGRYKVVDRDRHLLEEGRYKNGIKTGLWKSWYTNGALKSTWRRRYWFLGNVYNVREYDSNGNITKTGFEIKNRFTGSQVEWLGDSARVVRYKKGIAVLN